MPRQILALSMMLVLLVVAGCPVQDPQAGRLEVNDTLRQACWFMTDVEINTSISVCEADRQAGWTYPAEVNGLMRSCLTSPLGLRTCSDCFVAIIDQVYGQ